MVRQDYDDGVRGGVDHADDDDKPTSLPLTPPLSGVLTIVADFMGAIGSGTGLLLAVTTIYECARAHEIS